MLSRQEGGSWGVLGVTLMQTSLALHCFKSVVSRQCLEIFQRPQALLQPITAMAQMGFHIRLCIPPTFPLSRKKNKTAGFAGLHPPSAGRVMATALGFPGPCRELPPTQESSAMLTPRLLLAEGAILRFFSASLLLLDS